MNIRPDHLMLPRQFVGIEDAEARARRAFRRGFVIGALCAAAVVVALVLA
ncbi:MAG: hypothetical protein ACK4TJ_00830 [Tabrizicola sp.]